MESFKKKDDEAVKSTFSLYGEYAGEEIKFKGSLRPELKQFQQRSEKIEEPKDTKNDEEQVASLKKDQVSEEFKSDIYNTLKYEHQPTVEKSNLVKPKVTSTDVKSIGDFKTETVSALNSLKNSVGQEQIEKLLNFSKNQNNNLLAVELGNKISKLTQEQETELTKKIEEWKVPKDISEANATVVLTWLKDIK